MRLGLTLGYWGLGLSPAEQLCLVKDAEALGYQSVWAAEAYGSDAPSVLGWLASQTSNIRLGSGVFQIPARTPAMTAMTAATIDHLSDGRFMLGLGVSGPQVSEGWHGVPFERPLQRTADYVAIIRMALSGAHVRYSGAAYTLPLPGGAGGPLKLTIAPRQQRIPIYLAAIGPKNIELAGEIADGWMPVFFSPEHVDLFRSHLDAGALRAGRDVAEIDIAPNVNVLVTDDLAAGRDAIRPFLTLYLGGMGSRNRNFYVDVATEYGFGTAARRVQELYLEGKKTQASAAVPDELIDAVSIVGPAGLVKERLAAFRDAGVGNLLCSAVLATSFEEKREQLRLIADLAIADPAA